VVGPAGLIGLVGLTGPAGLTGLIGPAGLTGQRQGLRQTGKAVFSLAGFTGQMQRKKSQTHRIKTKLLHQPDQSD
jgi:hypothetical protein